MHSQQYEQQKKGNVNFSGKFPLAAPRASSILVPYHSCQASIGSDNGLAPNKWQAIIWTKDGLVYFTQWVKSNSGSFGHVFILYWLVMSVSGTAIVGCINSSPPWTKWPPFCRQYFEMHFREWKFCILIKISLNFVPNGPIDNNQALV